VHYLLVITDASITAQRITGYDITSPNIGKRSNRTWHRSIGWYSCKKRGQITLERIRESNCYCSENKGNVTAKF